MSDLCLQPLTDGNRCQLVAQHIVTCSADPDAGWVPVPDSPWDEIAPRLWQGGSMAGSRYHDPNEGDFDSVLTLFRTAPWADPPLNERRFHFHDAHGIPDGLADAALWTYQQWALQKRHVLVRCQAGLNRSGLIVALVLMMDGHDVDDAIRLVRERRSPYALCNSSFVTYLRSQP